MPKSVPLASPIHVEKPTRRSPPRAKNPHAKALSNNKGFKGKEACAVKSRGLPLKKKPGHLSAKSIKKYDDDNKHKKQREEAYEWAMDLLYSEEERMKKKDDENKLHLTSVAQMATDKYHISVSSSTLSTLKSRGSKTIFIQGRKEEVSDEEFDDVAEALVSYIAISQINGNAKFDAWKEFFIDYGFALNNGPPEGFEGEIYFSEERKRRILNLDENFLSLDGSTTVVEKKATPHALL
eukprot:scaffold27367_cov24-Attheya_sp.AAC.1